MNALRLLTLFSFLSASAHAQMGSIASNGELPLLGFIGGGILAGGVLSLMKTRHQK